MPARRGRFFAGDPRAVRRNLAAVGGPRPNRPMSFQIVLLVIAVLLSVPPIFVVLAGSQHSGDRDSFVARHFRALALTAIAVWAVCVELQFWTEFSAWKLATSLIGVTVVAAALVLHASRLRSDESDGAPG